MRENSKSCLRENGLNREIDIEYDGKEIRIVHIPYIVIKLKRRLVSGICRSKDIVCFFHKIFPK